MRILNFFILPLAVCLFGGAACHQEANQNRPQMTNTSNAATANNLPKTGEIPTYTYEVVNTYKHDSKAFTQGLVFRDGFLYESTGNPDYEGKSSLRKVRIEDGDVVQDRKLDKQYFAEGITILGDKIYQLTWQENTCFVYDLNSFDIIGKFNYFGEGWGLTSDGANLIMSDGSHLIKFIDPTNFRVTRTISVNYNGKPLHRLNELEFIKGEIWANIWHSEEKDVLGKPNTIARIDPNTGKVVGWIDLQNISPEDVARNEENTLNGIAYDPANDRIFVTGKQWKKLFEIKIRLKS